ncbi:hypothetical protein [Frondihabitans australicus]|uniref:Uridine kinase n=1 Tax=Frondihabitans australicus TaxID=386892 RepID=A0A495ICV9_9MICO|nr:hypothetical protein [Frondihabitans australicus]RKR73843.1 hypothetical protein C8E83_0940 [Frondihabitans australicus]
MTRWAPEKSDTLAALATEILHNYSRGRVLVAVDGPDRVAASGFADDVAAAVEGADHVAGRSTADGLGDDAFRSQVAAPFRAADGDALLVVDHALTGRTGLSGAWNYAVWVVGDFVADRSPEERGRANAVIDASDPEHPRRLFDDAC